MNQALGTIFSMYHKISLIQMIRLVFLSMKISNIRLVSHPLGISITEYTFTIFDLSHHLMTRFIKIQSHTLFLSKSSEDNMRIPSNSFKHLHNPLNHYQET